MKVLFFCFLSILVRVSTSSLGNFRQGGGARRDRYRGNVHVVPSTEESRRRLATGGGIVGTVFEDINMDGIQQDNEPGVPDVMVSDGRTVVLTNSSGGYTLPKPSADDEEGGFSIFVTEPDCYDAPISEENIPQFFYVHKPQGSPANIRGDPFRYGGLPPTGPMPAEINFPLVKTGCLPQFKVVVSGDPQSYSNTEIGYLRDSTIKEVSMMDDVEAIIFMGDVMGDDLSLYPRMKKLVATTDTVQYFAAGNHDYDFDAPHDRDSFDTFRREFGPEYYSFDIGNVHFVVLDDVIYPCTAEDNIDGLHGRCDEEGRYSYNGRITDKQMEWLANDLAHVPTDKLIFLQLHIPIHTFIDMNLVIHMVDNVVELYETLGCTRSEDGRFYPEDCSRPIVSMGAHSHTNENIIPGEDFEGWSVALDAGSLSGRAPGPPPFHQMIVGAACGSWWSGNFDSNVIPESYQRLGAPRGYYIFEFDGSSYVESFKAHHKPVELQSHMDIQTPAFVTWLETLKAWMESDPGADDVPPVNINDLPDTKIVTTAEHPDSYLNVNVWNGAKDTIVTASFNDGPELTMTRTQPGEGENMLQSFDVYALKRQLMNARFAYESTSGEPRANGIEQFRFSVQCPGSDPTACTPRPSGTSRWADQSSHLWQIPIPEDLTIGCHNVVISITDRYGRTYHDKMTFEILDERPPRFFKDGPWDVFP